MAESWAIVPGTSNLYEASDRGQVRRAEGRRVMKPQTNGRYLFVVPCVFGKKKPGYIHRLVMAAFCGESEKQVNHIDGDRSNNRLDNLEYVTPKENMAHATRCGLMPDRRGARGPTAILTEDQARYALEHRGYRGKTAKQLASELGVTSWAIYTLWRGQSWAYLQAEVGQ